MSNPFDSYVGQFQRIQHQNQEILFLEFHGGYESDALHWLELLTQELSNRKEHSVLFLADLVNVSYSPRLALEWQKHQELLDTRCLRVAAHRSKGIISIAIATFLNIAEAGGLEIGHKVRFFNDLDSAKEWLVQGLETEEPKRFFTTGDMEASD